MIKTDHKPLTHIFSESRAVPTMASGRIQRWAITLGAHDYSIRYKKGVANANADALSRLPLQLPDQQTPQPAEVVHLMEHLSTTPLSSSRIKSLTDGDPTLSRVRCLVLDGWSGQEAEPGNDSEFAAYARRRLELSVEGDVCCGGVGWWYRGKQEDKRWKYYMDRTQEWQR